MSQVPQDAESAIELLKSVGGDEMVAMMMQTFIQFAEERLAKLHEERASGNVSEVASIAHALKSSARQLGAHAMGEACAVVEHAGKTGDNDGALNGVDAIQREYAAAKTWMYALAVGA